MDALAAWHTATSSGFTRRGWVSFELERRGGGRTVNSECAAGGWAELDAGEVELVRKF